MKKLLAILLTFAMVFSLASVSVFAANEGKITITTRNAGTEYNIYKILDVDSTTADHSLVTYKVADKWAGFFATSAALNYVSIDENGAVTAKSTFTQTSAPEFAALAMAYAKANGITSDGTKTANGTDDVVDSRFKRIGGVSSSCVSLDEIFKEAKEEIERPSHRR